MNNFADRLIRCIKKKRSCIMVGLDPRPNLLPKSLVLNPKHITKNLLRFNRAVIDIVAAQVVGVKVQSAFYERWGYEGVKVFWETLGYAQQKGLMTIADVKRGDVPSTAEAYAEAYLNRAPRVVDAITVNPLLGGDSLHPFIKRAKENGQGVFILVKTSNPGSQDFQDKVLGDGTKFYELVARKVAHWGKGLVGQNGYSSLGAVVGATFPEAARKLRRLMREQVFLVPGYGAQGGKAEDLGGYFNQDGLGALITAARSVIHAYHPRDTHWREAIRQAVERMNKEIWSSLGRLPG